MAVDSRTLEAQHALILKAIANRFEGEFGDLFTRETLQHYVDDSYDQLARQSKVLTHIPAFVERFSRQRLRALAKTSGPSADHPVELLFVCERNDALSQMAAALFSAASGDRALVHSAGTAPGSELLDDAVQVLDEVGVGLDEAFPKPISAEVEQAADVIVTLDAHDDITIIPGKQYRAWRITDRSAEGLDGYRAMRDELQERVQALVAEVVSPDAPRTRAAFDRDLAELEALVMGMGGLVTDLVAHLTAALAMPEATDLDAIVAADDAIDGAFLAIETKAVGIIARRQPAARDLRSIVAFLQTGLHLERIADGGVGVAELLRPGVLSPSEPQVVLLADMAEQVTAMTDLALRSLADRSVDEALEVDRMLGQLSGLDVTRVNGLAVSARNGSPIDALVVADRISSLFERAADHAVDIAESVWFLVTGEFREFGREPVHPRGDGNGNR